LIFKKVRIVAFNPSQIIVQAFPIEQDVEGQHAGTGAVKKGRSMAFVRLICLRLHQCFSRFFGLA
jgi:hypothetical protein